jgi:dipeptidyl aminopeptidase/acylaminoacyl peptidase
MIRISAVDGSEKKEISEGEGWFSVSFSPTGEYFVLTYGGPDVPTQTLLSASNSSNLANIVIL